MITGTGRELYEFRGPFAPGLHGMGDAPAEDSAPGYWEQRWQDAVDQFKAAWTGFLHSKDTLLAASFALNNVNPADVDVGQLAALKAKDESLTQDESSIEELISAAIDKVHAIEDRLGWQQTQLGIFGVDDAVIIAGVVAAGVTAVGYYVYRITTHTQDVNQFSRELEALGKGVLTPDQLVQIQQTRNASTGSGGAFAEIFSQLAPYLGVGILGYIAFRTLTGRRA